jgi:hypothetical protein
MSRIHVFTGPTLNAADVRSIIPHALIHPPVKHGDLFRLNPGPKDVIVIIDGLFHQSPPVRHKEILALLSDGVTVVGASSMGALRAAELQTYGMVGIGYVFEGYRDGVFVADDEVAVAHIAEGNYRALSVPLVNIRYAVENAVVEGMLSRNNADLVVESSRSIPFPMRSWRLVLGQDSSAKAQDEFSLWLVRKRNEIDIKRIDAFHALDAVAAGRIGSAPRPIIGHERWRNSYLHAWRFRFHTQPLRHEKVNRAATMHYAQLFEPDFPRRWYELAIRCMAWSNEPQWAEETTVEESEERVLVFAHRDGLDLHLLRPDHIRRWLSRRERHDLTVRGCLLRLLVRLSGLSPGVPVISDQDRWWRELVARPTEVGASVIAAFTANQRLAASGRTIDNIRQTSLVRYLALEWAVLQDDADELTRAARDRGFASFDNAVEVFRRFVVARKQGSADGTIRTPASVSPTR